MQTVAKSQTASMLVEHSKREYMTRTLNDMSLAASHPPEVLLIHFTDIIEEYMTCET